MSKNKHIRMLDKNLIEKDNLRVICVNLMTHIPDLPYMPEDQMNDPVFCAGLLAGIITCLTSSYFPNHIADQNFTIPIINIVNLIVQKHGDIMGIKSETVREDSKNKPN